MENFDTISVVRLAELNHRQNVDVIDVRMPGEFGTIHAAVARNVPLNSLNPGDVMKNRIGTANEPVYIICQSGVRSRSACEQFVAAGFTNIVSVEGGTRAWDEAGLPVVRGEQSMSLERQVRITAGFLVLLGIVLATFVHPSLMGLSAFVGAGLMFAGITDTCGMGMILARMPWNKVSTNSQCSA
jgi:rhodanese-related sulfurtransferase